MLHVYNCLLIIIIIFRGRRIFYVNPDTEQEVQEWIEALRKNIQALSSGSSGSSTTTYSSKEAEAAALEAAAIASTTPAASSSSSAPLSGYIPGMDGAAAGGPAAAAAAAAAAAPAGGMDGGVPSNSSLIFSKLNAAKDCIGFLQEKDSKVFEFWKIWTSSIPPKEELIGGQSMGVTISASSDLEKISWRTAGPQNIFIQRMVDFFWNVGAPEPEIDRLNDVGASINPTRIGSWIDMSAKGGMDGGWFFPVDITADHSLDAADDGEPKSKLDQWIKQHNVLACFSVGRDMGAAPPRQTEVRLEMPGSDFFEQYKIVMDAFGLFGFPPLPEGAADILQQHHPNGLALSVITSCEGFVRMGVMVRNPQKELVDALVAFSQGNKAMIDKLEAAIGADKGPEFVELQYLMKGYGYGVYKEGFDVVLHWNAGEEWGEN